MAPSGLDADRRSQSTHKRLFSSTFGGTESSTKRAYMSMHVMDGMTDFEQAAPPNTRLYARPLNYTLSRSGGIPEAALMNTQPAGVPQTPERIHAFKRIVFDQRGKAMVNIVENDPEVKPPPAQINGTRKNLSADIFKPNLLLLKMRVNAQRKGQEKRPIPESNHQSHKRVSKKYSEMLKVCSMLKHERSANDRMLADLKVVKEAFKSFAV